MNCKGDVANWELFRQQWSDYEVATGLNRKKTKPIRLAALRPVMGRDCQQTFMNLKLSEADKQKVDN